MLVETSSSPTATRERSVRFGVGDGRFGAARTVAAGNAPSALAVADLNRDGRLDLAVGTQASDAGKYQPRLMIMLGNGTGGFRRAAGSPMAVPGAPSSLQVADLLGRQARCRRREQRRGQRHRSARKRRWRVPPGRRLSVLGSLADGACCRRPERRRRARFCVAARMASGCAWTPSTPATSRGRTLSGRPEVVLDPRVDHEAGGGRQPRRGEATAQSSRSCGQIIVWTAPGRRTKSFSTSNPGCGSILCPRGSCVDELALGDGQVAWISRSGGNNLELMVIVARLTGGAPKTIEWAFNGAGPAATRRVTGWGSSSAAERCWRTTAGGVACDSPNENACDLGEAALTSGTRGSSASRRPPRRREARRRLAPVECHWRRAHGGRVRRRDHHPSGRAALVSRQFRSAGKPAACDRAERTRLAVTRTFWLDLYSPRVARR